MGKPVGSNLDFIGGAKITGLPPGVNTGEPATIEQLNAAIEGLDTKADGAKVSTQGNINLSAPGATIDGIAMSLNDRVLVRMQTTTSQNGIYVWNGAAVAMTRSADGNTADELEQAIVTVQEGTDAGTTWRQTAVNFTLDTDPVLWTPFGVVAPPASTLVRGIIQIALQAEVDAGTDPDKAVVPATLAGSIWAKRKGAADFGDGSATQFDINHNFNTRDLHVMVYRTTAPYDDVLCDVERVSLNAVRLRFAAAPLANQYRVVVIA